MGFTIEELKLLKEIVNKDMKDIEHMMKIHRMGTGLSKYIKEECEKAIKEERELLSNRQELFDKIDNYISDNESIADKINKHING